MSPLKLYYATVSTPSRAVLMAIRNFGTDVEVITLNIGAGEHRSGEFPSINPQMCVPTIVDGDYMLWESKAILIYLASKHCGPFKGSLYPKCPHTRGLINQRLLFDSTDYYAAILNIINAGFGPEKVITKNYVNGIEKALAVMETFLDGHEYFVGDSLTIADFPFCASTCSLVNMGFDISGFPKVSAWYERMKELKGFDQCLAGARELGGIMKASLTNTFDDLK